MNKTEEIHLLLNLILHSSQDNSVDLNDKKTYESLFLTKDTRISEDYFFSLAEQNILEYEEIGEDGFKPIIICKINENTKTYLADSLRQLQTDISLQDEEIKKLKSRISELIAFDPYKITQEIHKIESSISETKKQIRGDSVLNALNEPLSKIERTFASIVKVTESYEDIYKSIILPVKEEGRSGVRQTVRWAIISIVASSIISIIITLVSNYISSKN